jgi:hypothetical protein
MVGVAVMSLGGVLWYLFVHRRREVAFLDLAVVVGSAVVLVTPVSWGHHGLAVSLGWALLAVRRRWPMAIAGAVSWSLPLFVWATEVPAEGKLPLQSIRPLSVFLLVIVLAATCSRQSSTRDDHTDHRSPALVPVATVAGVVDGTDHRQSVRATEAGATAGAQPTAHPGGER